MDAQPGKPVPQTDAALEAPDGLADDNCRPSHREGMFLAERGPTSGKLFSASFLAAPLVERRKPQLLAHVLDLERVIDGIDRWIAAEARRSPPRRSWSPCFASPPRSGRRYGA